MISNRVKITNEMKIRLKMLKTIKVIFLPSLSLFALLIPENRIEIWKDIGYTGRQCQKQQQMQSG